jgi:ethanolamine ammonia-lyase large subunit
VINADGKPGPHFGRPAQVYLQFQRRKGNTRTDEDLLAEAAAKMKEVRARGVELTESHGKNIWDLQPQVETKLRSLYADARQCLWAELPASAPDRFGKSVSVETLSKDREDYILHPPTGEQLSPSSNRQIAQLANAYQSAYDVQIVISDGLNALSLTDEGHIEPYLDTVREKLKAGGFKLAPQVIVVRNGRVRAGYRIGEALFGKIAERRSARHLVHLIGERPGSGHHAYSVYLTSIPVQAWAETGRVDHNLTRVISGIADTSYHPTLAADETVRLLSRAI